MKHILLINSDKMEPINILSRRQDIAVSVITKSKYAPLYDQSWSTYSISDLANITEASLAAIRIQKEKSIDAIVCPLERSLLTGGYIRSYFDLPGLSYSHTLGFANKLVMKRRLQEHDLPVADYLRLERIIDIPKVAKVLGWPIIVKQAVGSGCFNTVCLHSEEHLHELINTNMLDALDQTNVPLIAEKYIPIETEYSIDAVVYKGEVLFCAATQYLGPLLQNIGGLIGTHTVNENSPLGTAMRELLSKTINALDLQNGVTHMEIYKTDRGLIIGEITCRPGGAGVSQIIELHHGVSLWEAFINVSLHELPEITPHTRSGISGWVGLPGRNGYIHKITSAAKLAAIRGVERVEMKHRAGDTVDEKQTSVFYSGIVYFHVDLEHEVAVLIESLRECYYIETDRNILE